MKFEYRRSVTHRCGHSERHTFYAHSRQEADSWAFNMKKSDCSECREKAEKIAEETKVVVLPPLIGTPKKVTWANAIRHRIYNMLARSNRYQQEALCCRYETRADWWIDNRKASIAEILAHLADIGRRAA